MIRPGVAGVVAAAVFVSACHKKSAVTVTPLPTQPRTVNSTPPPRRKQQVAKKPAEAISQAQAAPAQEPKLVDYVNDEQRLQYAREIDASLRAVEENVQAFHAANRSGRQKEIERIESLVRQSRQEREAGDIATARKLASMARVLSQTLVP